MAYYQIKMTPVDTFFFGSEKHDNNERANYFVESNCYPQQTTILGFIRYLLLFKNDLIGTDDIKTKGEPIIGKESFDYNNTNQSFGKIKSISPLYFLFKDELYFPAPLDVDYLMNSEQGSYFLIKDKKKYTAKNGQPNLQLVNVKGENRISLFSDKPSESVVYSIKQTGNEKTTDESLKDEKFYKQTFMKMNEGWSFGVLADIDQAIPDEPLYLPLGGEKSLFKIEIRKNIDPLKTVPEFSDFKRDIPLIYFLSDSFAESKIMNYVAFAVNSVVSFRNFKSSVKTVNYADFGKKSNGLKPSSRYNLITRGSVLYFETAEKRSNAIEILEKEHCKRIGFNAYKLIN